MAVSSISTPCQCSEGGVLTRYHCQVGVVPESKPCQVGPQAPDLTDSSPASLMPSPQLPGQPYMMQTGICIWNEKIHPYAEITMSHQIFEEIKE